jgi:branched-chain amino acid transport system permease protein
MTGRSARVSPTESSADSAWGSALPHFAAFLGLAVVLAVVPAFAGNYTVKLLQEILIWGIFAMSLDLLMGYAGMISFGHSAFFGVGGYVAALALKTSPGLVSALLLPALAAALLAAIIGFCSIRVSGVYFIMLTLAFSQMFYAYAFQVAWLGAEDGIIGVPRVVLLGASLGSPALFHPYLVTIFVLSALALWRVVRSPFGHVLRGIQENEARMEAVGYPVDRYKLLAFVVAGTVAGVAGALLTQLNGSISPDAFFWTTSGEALLMVIIGGTGTLWGAVLGAAAFILLQSLVSTYTERWMLILGLTFILFVLFAPGGIIGVIRGRSAIIGALRGRRGVSA